MTTKSDLPKLFNFDPKTTRITAFGLQPGIVFNPEAPCASPLGLMFPLADTKTKRRTDKSLTVLVSPLHAMSLARAILKHAENCDWEEPEGGEYLQVDRSPNDKLN